MPTSPPSAASVGTHQFAATPFRSSGHCTTQQTGTRRLSTKLQASQLFPRALATRMSMRTVAIRANKRDVPKTPIAKSVPIMGTNRFPSFLIPRRTATGAIASIALAFRILTCLIRFRLREEYSSNHSTKTNLEGYIAGTRSTIRTIVCSFTLE